MKEESMKRILFALLAISLFTSPLWADYKEALKKGDYASALREISPLAQKGNAEAQSTLGMMYSLGLGVSQNQEEALKWFRKAADQGDAEGQYNLGLMYASGKGVVKNYSEACKWFKKAADQGHARAQYNLGVMYFQGWGAHKDYVRAYMWWSLATLGGHQEAGKNRNIVSAKMTPAQIAEAQKLTREWKPKKQ